MKYPIIALILSLSLVACGPQDAPQQDPNEGLLLQATAEVTFFEPYNAATARQTVLGATNQVSLMSQRKGREEITDEQFDSFAASTLQQLSYAYGVLGDPILALEASYQALQASGCKDYAKYNFGNALMSVGMFDDVLENLEPEIAANPHDAQHQRTLLDYYFLTEDTLAVEQQAFHIFDITLDAKPRAYAAIQLYLASLAYQNPPVYDFDQLVNMSVWPGPILAFLKGDIQEQELLYKIIQVDEGDAKRGRMTEALFFIGEYHRRSGNYFKAVEYYKALMTLQVNSFRETQYAKFILNKLLLEMGGEPV